jgi:hypothetical protein
MGMIGVPRCDTAQKQAPAHTHESHGNQRDHIHFTSRPW